ncbi:hypothetical protein EC912_103161 [Luteibacter rhizovicinus]|uniref:Uncharacterized protein n=1 Tax=Luteibacter rhizovicinus TaxID=242606 RepID=A0A4R3YQN4_9GAMM|nr:hypothetical protein [Luteibacter rhizovicinus]TCV94676.1 hypothetical protein EC912_103161 [Luteibacter rhizovicinus]
MVVRCQVKSFARHVSMRRLGVAGAALIAIAGVAFLACGPVRLGDPATVEVKAGHAGLPPPLYAVLGPDEESLGQLLNDHDDFASDVTFLIVAAQRQLCFPDHAHELEYMAVAAQLPVLKGSATALAGKPAWRGRLYSAIREIASRAPCEGRFDAGIGSFHVTIESAKYAQAFPDSFFDLSLVATPVEYGGESLGDRSQDDCVRIAYGALPLDEMGTWQCAAVRADARKHVVELCRQRMASIGTSGNQDQLASAIHGAATRLPASCR